MNEKASQAAIVVGASGGIGHACIERLLDDEDLDYVVGISRQSQPPLLYQSKRLHWLNCDSQEANIENTCHKLVHLNLSLRYIVIATGLLHDESSQIKPEKRLAELSTDHLETVFSINTFLPAIWLKHLTLCLNRDSHTDIAVLSARVGSISDNRLGGWHSYRASKAALNMLLKNIAIEFKRRYPKVKLTSFHPGTTDTHLSEPYQANVPEGKLFTPEFVAEQLHQLLTHSVRDGELAFKDWAHKDIEW